MEELWIKVKKLMQEEMKQHLYSMWIAGLRYESCENGLLALNVPNNFSKNRIEKSYLSTIKVAWKKLSGNEIEIKLTVKETEKAVSAEVVQKINTIKPPFNFSSKNPRPLRKSFSFETFVAGPQNAVAFHAAKAIASSVNGNVPNGIILFLASNGLGKTHLAQSAVALRNQEYPALVVSYLTVQDFTDMMTKAMRKSGNFAKDTKVMEDFKKKFITSDLFVLDEVDHLPGKNRTQKELAFIIDHLMDRDKKIIYCSNTSPDMIKSIDNKIRSLLGMAPVIKIDPPDQETRAKIFTQKAQLWGSPIPHNVASYLAESVRGDVRKIEGTLVQLMLNAQTLKKSIDLSFAQKVLESILLKQEGVTPDFILNLVSKTFDISVSEIKSISKKQNIVWPRYVVIYLLLKYCKLTHETIGALINRSHSAIPRVPDEIKKHIANTQKKLQLEHVENLLQKRVPA